jgi:hypothetical protein
MKESTAPFETLKQILRHARQPDLLNDHPWTQSLIVQEALANDPRLAQASPGQQLIGALAGLFKQLQPANPPRAGKRLDPRWGEFGLLAALYFAPFNHGTSFPTSLMEAWCRIDPAILHFVYGKPAEALCAEEIRRYELVGADVAYGAASTLSDWHRKGLQRFAEFILNRERFLARNAAQISSLSEDPQTNLPSGSEQPEVSSSSRGRSRVIRRFLWLGVTLLLLAALGLGALKARKIYNAGMPVYRDVTGLQKLARQPLEAETLNRALPILHSLRDHLSLLKEEARPLLWLSPRLGWVPTYGEDLRSAPAVLEVAEHSLNAAILSAEAARPLVDEFQSPESALTPAQATALLVQIQPQLEEARAELDQALTARRMLPADELSPHLRSLILEDLDPVLKMADEGMSVAAALPGLLGAGSDGPKTYLLLAQNEDELRPTGGFITSVGKLVVHNGEVISLNFESVDNDVQEDWTKPYPAAPWQLQEYMDSRVLILRDANWFTDFPTTVLWVEYLYAYKHSHSVDGVIAFDQNFLVGLLGEIGPLEVEGVPYAIDEKNVIEYMRQAKVPPSQEIGSLGWDRKEFIRKIAGSVLQRLDHGRHDWLALARVLSGALDERHLLLQFDDPVISRLTARRGWDNAVRPEQGDYLMVTDTNIGSNKTNVLVDVRLTYDVDLGDLTSPRGTLTVSHQNNASKEVPCRPMTTFAEFEEETWYPINRCYWNYLRVYKQEGVKLLDATPQAIPGGWLLSEESLPPQVDMLDEEIPGVLGFGTMQVVRGGQSLSTSFEFALPVGTLVMSEDSSQWSYRLKVQKQPGTLENALTIRIHLPSHATLKSAPLGAIVEDNNLLFETNLRTNVNLNVVFALP